MSLSSHPYRRLREVLRPNESVPSHETSAVHPLADAPAGSLPSGDAPAAAAGALAPDAAAVVVTPDAAAAALTPDAPVPATPLPPRTEAPAADAVARTAHDVLAAAAASSSDPGGAELPLLATQRQSLRNAERIIDWSVDGTAAVIAKIEPPQGPPGALDHIAGTAFRLFGAHPEKSYRGDPGEIIARRDGAICRATVDGAVWITHLMRHSEDGSALLKLPALDALVQAGYSLDLPETPAPLHAPLPAGETYREIRYEEANGVGYLHFDFYNGAMSTVQARRLREAYRYARSRRDARVIVLMGGLRSWSNGIHLNLIEASEEPGEASWFNLLAINDVVREIVETDSQLVMSALSGGAGAGGVSLALAADHVVGREGVVLNPYYRHMGDLYGSEYWTYLLPRRVGADLARELTTACVPVDHRRALEIGLLDDCFGDSVDSFRSQVTGLAERLARHPDFGDWLEEKRRRRARDEALKPLAAYAMEELTHCHENFFGSDRSYHEARRQFVYKRSAPCASPEVRVPAGAPLLRAAMAGMPR